MKSSAKSSSRPSFGALPQAAQAYVGLIIALGWAALAYSLYQVSNSGHSALPVLALATLFTSCLGFHVSIPLFKAGGFAFTVSDCFVFMGLLLYGPAAAVCLGAVDGIVGSVRFGIKSVHRTLFNVAGIALTAYVISQAFGLAAATLPGERPFLLSTGIVAAVALSAICYFALSSLIVAGAMALASKQAVGSMWSTYFPRTSPTTLLSVAAGLLFILALDYSGAAQLLSILLGASMLAASVSYGAWAKERILSLELSETS